uniref:Uncharacterized protein n=1 Tax=Utricularia reniformis TaxID=192314 RepID=A0A1Y0AZQ4_9LAMI|nr:hypothetical protein AEK19_MT0339 [Utricularia reniformis]ART30611.1 hypothetical protein AEK19_MT0339 [Utricularia reniformis]
MYHLVCILFIIYARNRKRNTISDVFLVLIIRLFGAFTLYHGWHFILFLITLWNNWGCPMDFLLGVNDVSLLPILQTKPTNW